MNCTFRDLLTRLVALPCVVITLANVIVPVAGPVSNRVHSWVIEDNSRN